MAEREYLAKRTVAMAVGLWKPGEVRVIDPTDPRWAGPIERGALVPHGDAPKPRRSRAKADPTPEADAPAEPPTYPEAVAADLAAHQADDTAGDAPADE